MPVTEGMHPIPDGFPLLDPRKVASRLPESAIPLHYSESPGSTKIAEHELSAILTGGPGRLDTDADYRAEPKYYRTVFGAPHVVSYRARVLVSVPIRYLGSSNWRFQPFALLPHRSLGELQACGFSTFGRLSICGRKIKGWLSSELFEFWRYGEDRNRLVSVELIRVDGSDLLDPVDR